MTLMLLTALISCKKETTVNADCVEKLREGVVCTLQYAPVCGCNNKTYGNACEAESFGIVKYTNGECAKK